MYYLEIRREVKRAIKNEKNAYYEFKLRHKNSSDVWTEARKLGLWNHKNCQLPENFEDPQEISDYFESCVPQQAIDESTIDYYKNIHNAPTFKFNLSTPEEVKKVFLSITPKSVGYDGISHYMLQLLLPYCLSPLTHIINVSLESGNIPKLWKTAIVHPIPKISNIKELKDLRPINLLPVCAKLLEKIVYYQISGHLETFKAFPKNQSGLMKFTYQ